MNNKKKWLKLQQDSSIQKLDLSVLRSLDEMSDQDGTESLAVQVIQIFLEISPDIIKKILDGAATGDLEGVRQQAHSLKSSSANIGAMELAGLCQTIEKEAAAAGATTDGIVRLAAELSRELQNVKSILQLILKELS